MASASDRPPSRRKLAYVIQIGRHQRPEHCLDHAAVHAGAVANLLRQIEFHVVTARDLDKGQLLDAVIEFSKTVNNGDLTVFYLVGQVCQANGRNYIVPANSGDIRTNLDVEDYCVDLAYLLETVVEKNPSYVNAFILDCPGTFAVNSTASSNSAKATKGFCNMQPINSAFIQFACAPGQVDRGQLFHKHLLRRLAEENVHLTDVFQSIANDVSKESNGTQRPLSIDGLRQRRDVFLNHVIPPPKPELRTEDYFTNERPSQAEQSYYEDCKEVYRLTGEPLVSVADGILAGNGDVSSSVLKFGVDENCSSFPLQSYMEMVSATINVPVEKLSVRKVQSGSSIVEVEISPNCGPTEKRVCLRMICDSITDKVKKALGKAKVFFMYLGPAKDLLEKQKRRAAVQLIPKYNRRFVLGQDFWIGALKDHIDRGDNPYYCPVGWQRWSFYVADDFKTKFNGWSIGYHGTKFAYGLSILLSGLKTARVAAHGKGIYLTPSIIYACHPRYAEVKSIKASPESKFFKKGKYAQFVLECRVHPSYIKKAAETLEAQHVCIDNNVDNGQIEWVASDQNKEIVDFNDPDASVVCSGLMVRVTDNHPGLLPDSRWWLESHLCDQEYCCANAMGRSSLEALVRSGQTCNIIID